MVFMVRSVRGGPWAMKAEEKCGCKTPAACIWYCRPASEAWRCRLEPMAW